MPAYVETLNQFLALGTIGLQVVVVALLLNLIFFRSHSNQILLFFKKNTFSFGFMVALCSTLLSLFYSNVVGFPPCELCWINRIFIYPQVILFGMELYKRDKAIIDQSLVLAIFSALTSIFHVYIENGGASSLACATGGPATVSCATLYVYEFGYVTIPLMALTTALFTILLLVNYKYMSKAK
jgi:disulfide bond formation protein DsbB